MTLFNCRPCFDNMIIATFLGVCLIVDFNFGNFSEFVHLYNICTCTFMLYVNVNLYL